MAGQQYKTLFNRISQLLILMACLVFLFSLGLFRTIKAAYDKQFYRTFRETISIAAAYLEYEVEKISEMTLHLATDDNLQGLIRNDIPRTYGVERVHVRDFIKDILFNQAFGDFYISQIELDLLDGDMIQLGRSVGSLGSEYSPVLKEKPGYVDGKDYYFVGRDGVLINVRNIRDVSSLDFYTMGTMLTYIDIELLIEKYQRQIPYYSDLSFLVIKDGEMLNPTDKSRRIYESIKDMTEGFSFYKNGDEYYFISVVPGREEGWQFVGYTSLRDIKNLNRNLWTGLILTHVILVLLLIISGRRYVRLFTKPLEQLSRDLHAIERNVFDIALKPPSVHMTEEINGLYMDVDLALKKIQDQVYKDYVKQMSLQKTQLQMLRSQINPHFLYNTLDSISWMAKASGEKDLARMVLSLGRLLRHSLSERRERIPLRDELALLDDYLAIQKIRFQEKLAWSQRIETGMESAMILPFVLQPLVENAIKYGIEEGDGSLSISLSIRRIGDRIDIKVCDNGRGFPMELLDYYRTLGMDELVSRGMLGVGLRNIYERIRLFYKGQGELILENGRERGACGILSFPLIMEKDGQ